MSGKKRAEAGITSANVERLMLQHGKEDFERGLLDLDDLPDGPHKSWILGVKKNTDDAALLIKDLRRQYPGIDTPEQLPQLGVEYRDAIPILIHWLPRIDNPDVKASIATALGQKWIGKIGIAAIADAITTTLKRLPPSQRRDFVIEDMINSLVAAANDDDLPRVVKICIDSNLPASAKDVLIDLLGRRRTKSSAEALKALTKGANEQQLLNISNELLKNRSTVARKYIADLKQHPVASMRDIATKAVSHGRRK